MTGQRFRWLIGAGLTAVMLLSLPIPSAAEVVKKYDPSLGKQDLMLIGLGELTFHALSIKGNKQAFEDGNRWLNSDFASTYRASLFANGNLNSKLFLNGTAIVDSRIEDEYRTADPSLFRLKMSVNTTEPLWDGWRFTGYGLYDPQRQWELANLDTRLLTQPQQSSRLELLARLESDRHGYIEGGSLHPSFGNTAFTLNKRSLFGTFADLHSGAVGIEAVGGKLEGKNFREGTVTGIRADGTSGPYDLAHAPITRGSDLVKVETRDRFNETTVLDSRTLLRDIDYTVDYLRGRITLHQPVASETPASDPVYIVITYDYQREADDDLAGGRIRVNAADGIEAGVSGLHRFVDNDASGGGEDEPQNLAGADLTVKMENLGTAYVEAAGSDNLDDPDEYTAVRAGFDADVTDDWKLKTAFQRIDDQFRSFTNSDLNANKNQQRLSAATSYQLSETGVLSAGVTDLRGLDSNGTFNTYNGLRDEMIYSLGYKDRLPKGFSFGLRLERRDVKDRADLSNEHNRRQRAIVDLAGTREKLGFLGRSGLGVHYELMTFRDHTGTGPDNTNSNQIGLTLSSEPSAKARIELTQRLRLQDNIDLDLTDQREDASFAAIRVKPHQNLSTLATLEYKRYTNPGNDLTFWQDDPTRIDKAGTAAFEYQPGKKVKFLGKGGRHDSRTWPEGISSGVIDDFGLGQFTWFATHHLSLDAESEYRWTKNENIDITHDRTWDLGLRLNWNRDRFDQFAAGIIRRHQTTDVTSDDEVTGDSYILLVSGAASLGKGFFTRGSVKSLLLRESIGDEKTFSQVEFGYEGRHWYRVSVGYEWIENQTELMPQRYYRGHGAFVRVVGKM